MKNMKALVTITTLIIGLTACNGTTPETSTEQTTVAETSIEITETIDTAETNLDNMKPSMSVETSLDAPSWTEESMLADIHSRILTIIEEGARITKYGINDRHFEISADLSEVETEPFTMADIAELSVSRITEEILVNEDHDQFWDTVTVDCGDAGKVTCNKSDIRSNENGGRYFDAVVIYDQIFHE